MPRGASPEREREYDQLKRRFQKERRYRGREEEVAARIVNQQRAQYAETRGARQQEREGRAPDKDLPIKGYRHLTIPQIEGKLDRLSGRQLGQVARYERTHKQRKGVLRAIEARRSR